MSKRTSSLVLLLCAAFFLPGGFLPEAAAQSGSPLNPSLSAHVADASDLRAMLRRTFVPARIYRLTAPDSLVVGEEARFDALANVEAATFPLRPAWDFGDGATAASLHARHRYRAPGTYRVVFTLSNGADEVADTLQVMVLPRGMPRR